LIGYIPQLIARFMGIVTVVKTVAAGLAFLAGAVSWPVIAIVAALAAAAALIYAYWEPIKEFFLDLWDGIKVAGIAIWDALKVAWESTVHFSPIYGAVLASFSRNFGNRLKRQLSEYGKALS